MIDDSDIITKLFDNVKIINEKLYFYKSLYETPEEKSIFNSLSDLMIQLRVINSHSILEVEEFCYYLIKVENYSITSSSNVEVEYIFERVIFTQDKDRYESLSELPNMTVYSDKNEFFEFISTLTINTSELNMSNSKIIPLFKSKKSPPYVIMCLKLFKNSDLNFSPPSKEDFIKLNSYLTVNAANDTYVYKKVA